MHQVYDSLENYLEAIYVLHMESDKVLSIDLANDLDLSRASVSNAVKKMRDKGYVIMEKGGNLVLTEEGERIGREINERHQTVKKILIHIGVDKDLADHDACRIEHALSQETFEAIKKFLDKNSKDN